MKKIYLAGGLFSAGEQVHNLLLEKALKKLGYEIILPQREALKACGDRKTISRNCKNFCLDPKNILVGNVDGPDADSGTCVEFGISIIAQEAAVIYRTDFRTYPEKEIGVNLMLALDKTVFVYKPCFLTELNQVEKYYNELALEIHKAIQSFQS